MYDINYLILFTIPHNKQCYIINSLLLLYSSLQSPIPSTGDLDSSDAHVW